ncbi:MAG TPA: aminotransferase class V-fold PLP-dependent enzyme [Gaiellaceae bacterium]|nr:aminotransferase class V-fold PLP-dependent enzyme [Gaiellaceae bacterium]
MKEHFLLDPGVVFLNHGSFGACPAPVFEAYQRFQRELERQPVEFLALERRLPELLDVARLRLASYVGARPDTIAFAPNASSALNAVVRSLDLRPGDEVLLGDAEYGGMERLWAYVAGRSRATLVRRPFDELEPGPRTRVVFCSHVEWTSGRVNDVAEICRRARDAGALSIVDGAHAPGQIDVDLEATGADIYSGNCHKWLCAPKGSAFLYARPEAQPLIDPLVVSWDWVDGAAFHQVHRWQGTRDPSAYLAVPAAIDFQAEHDWPAVRRRCHELLAAHDFGLEPLTEEFAQMRGFRIDHPDPAALKRRLYDEHRIEVPVFETAHGWALRVSVQGYNDERDLQALDAALASSL